MEALFHLGAKELFNPGICRLQTIGFEDAPDLSFYSGGVAGESEKVIAGELDEKFSVYLSPEGKDPLTNIKGKDSISHPGLGAGLRVEIRRKS